MYGIMHSDGNRVLCHGVDPVGGVGQYINRYVLKRWDRKGLPVMMGNPYEIDELLQKIIVDYNEYSLVVFKFSKEQEASLIIQKLKGH